ncbi:hypothetical protein TVAG_165290 [Trichomonas vaginalis G3]|uniref:Uncharacterized protein n=1 Tax=Trichomonas vaginalis (strain ATCC PRA-98 / G3) TaxID=412133 RepID=A2DUL0_TRIV3|nr:Rad51/NUKS-interacting protein family [Trichomonas vaginalis G3]EAY15901.1 hypothetical protein TVAG_165290 [Trichomonas vaginalis G3]KAI5506638.1 Rad51/NUKS-interacting protein family [Trichomonas vaginalis G3]|eukprot:XP_001328124.1 hypothetical protein [Trichomonas vaginalis G3]
MTPNEKSLLNHKLKLLDNQSNSETPDSYSLIITQKSVKRVSVDSKSRSYSREDRSPYSNYNSSPWINAVFDSPVSLKIRLDFLTARRLIYSRVFFNKWKQRYYKIHPRRSSSINSPRIKKHDNTQQIHIDSELSFLRQQNKKSEKRFKKITPDLANDKQTQTCFVSDTEPQGVYIAKSKINEDNQNSSDIDREFEETITSIRKRRYKNTTITTDPKNNEYQESDESDKETNTDGFVFETPKPEKKSKTSIKEIKSDLSEKSLKNVSGYLISRMKPQPNNARIQLTESSSSDSDDFTNFVLKDVDLEEFSKKRKQKQSPKPKRKSSKSPKIDWVKASERMNKTLSVEEKLAKRRLLKEMAEKEAEQQNSENEKSPDLVWKLHDQKKFERKNIKPQNDIKTTPNKENKINQNNSSNLDHNLSDSGNEAETKSKRSNLSFQSFLISDEILGTPAKPMLETSPANEKEVYSNPHLKSSKSQKSSEIENESKINGENDNNEEENEDNEMNNDNDILDKSNVKMKSRPNKRKYNDSTDLDFRSRNSPKEKDYSLFMNYEDKKPQRKAKLKDLVSNQGQNETNQLNNDDLYLRDDDYIENLSKKSKMKNDDNETFQFKGFNANNDQDYEYMPRYNDHSPKNSKSSKQKQKYQNVEANAGDVPYSNDNNQYEYELNEEKSSSAKKMKVNQRNLTDNTTYTKPPIMAMTKSRQISEEKPPNIIIPDKPIEAKHFDDLPDIQIELQSVTTPRKSPKEKSKASPQNLQIQKISQMEFSPWDDPEEYHPAKYTNSPKNENIISKSSESPKSSHTPTINKSVVNRIRMNHRKSQKDSPKSGNLNSPNEESSFYNRNIAIDGRSHSMEIFLLNKGSPSKIADYVRANEVADSNPSTPRHEKGIKHAETSSEIKISQRKSRKSKIVDGHIKPAELDNPKLINEFNSLHDRLSNIQMGISNSAENFSFDLMAHVIQDAEKAKKEKSKISQKIPKYENSDSLLTKSPTENDSPKSKFAIFDVKSPSSNNSTSSPLVSPTMKMELVTDDIFDVNRTPKHEKHKHKNDQSNLKEKLSPNDSNDHGFISSPTKSPKYSLDLNISPQKENSSEKPLPPTNLQKNISPKKEKSFSEEKTSNSEKLSSGKKQKEEKTNISTPLSQNNLVSDDKYNNFEKSDKIITKNESPSRVDASTSPDIPLPLPQIQSPPKKFDIFGPIEENPENNAKSDEGGYIIIDSDKEEEKPRQRKHRNSTQRRYSTDTTEGKLLILEKAQRRLSDYLDNEEIEEKQQIPEIKSSLVEKPPEKKPKFIETEIPKPKGMVKFKEFSASDSEPGLPIYDPNPKRNPKSDFSEMSDISEFEVTPVLPDQEVQFSQSELLSRNIEEGIDEKSKIPAETPPSKGTPVSNSSKYSNNKEEFGQTKKSSRRTPKQRRRSYQFIEKDYENDVFTPSKLEITTPRSGTFKDSPDSKSNVSSVTKLQVSPPKIAKSKSEISNNLELSPLSTNERPNQLNKLSVSPPKIDDVQKLEISPSKAEERTEKPDLAISVANSREIPKNEKEFLRISSNNWIYSNEEKENNGFSSTPNEGNQLVQFLKIPINLMRYRKISEIHHQNLLICHQNKPEKDLRNFQFQFQKNQKKLSKKEGISLLTCQQQTPSRPLYYSVSNSINSHTEEDVDLVGLVFDIGDSDNSDNNDDLLISQFKKKK